MRASRFAPTASRSTRCQVCASTGLRNSAPTSGTWPPGSQMAALLGHSVSNSGRTPSMVAGMRGTNGTPCSA